MPGARRLTAGRARRIVFARDGWTCVAPMLGATTPCYDKGGRQFSGYDPTGSVLEADRVGEGPGSRSASHEDPLTMLTACPGHHRGEGPNRGHRWMTAHREECRAYLARPAVVARTRALMDAETY